MGSHSEISQFPSVSWKEQGVHLRSSNLLIVKMHQLLILDSQHRCPQNAHYMIILPYERVDTWQKGSASPTPTKPNSPWQLEMRCGVGITFQYKLASLHLKMGTGIKGLRPHASGIWWDLGTVPFPLQPFLDSLFISKKKWYVTLCQYIADVFPRDT